MSYTIDYTEKWIHVRFHGDIHAGDVIRQTGEEQFQSELLRLKRVIYDYSDAITPDFPPETLKQFSMLARFLAELYDHIEVVSVPSDPDNLEKLEAYKRAAHSDKWRVSIARTPEHAVELMKTLCRKNR